MPRIKFIGNYDVLAEGKFLLEILGQLKNFGANRLVTKTEWMLRWPDQPSYLKIRKVIPEMDRWLWRGKVWADWTYRGKALGAFLFSKELNRSDWKLIHKHEEEKFCKCDKPFVERQIPSRIPLPPLQRYLLKRDASQGKDYDGVTTKPPVLQYVEHIDEEFEVLNSYTTKNEQLNPKPTGSIYDIDRSIYLDLYGNILPLKIEKWGQ